MFPIILLTLLSTIIGVYAFVSRSTLAKAFLLLPSAKYTTLLITVSEYDGYVIKSFTEGVSIAPSFKGSLIIDMLLLSSQFGNTTEVPFDTNKFVYADSSVIENGVYLSLKLFLSK